MRKHVQQNNSLYRLMCESIKGLESHIDFTNKAEALLYIENMNTSDIAWYGLYDVGDTLKCVVHKRIVPIDDRIPIEFLNIKKRVRKHK